VCYAFPQKHGFAVGKPKQIGEHPISCAKRVLLADVAVDQLPDIYWHFQPAGILVRFSENRRVFPVAAHEAIHADGHQLV